MRKLLAIFQGLVFLSVTGGAVAGEWHSSLGIERFDWYEFDSTGAEILHESGPRLFVELSTRSEYSPRLGAIYSGRSYGASVDYDGQTQGGVPVTTNSLYLGFSFEALFDYKLSVGRVSYFDASDWYLTYGLGYDGWLRGIQDAGTVAGYNEFYQVIYSKFGLMLDTNERTRIQFGAKLPLMIREDVAFSRFSTIDGVTLADIELAPGATTTLYASIDYKMTDRWNIRVYYEHYLFEASPSVNLLTASGDPVYSYDSDGDGVADWNSTDDGTNNPVLANQPESDLRTIGVRFTFGY